MFTGIGFEKAIDYYRKGKEVIVLDRASVGKNGKSGYDTFPFEELFKDLDFLVDVPAVINPDFEQAVQGMTEADQADPEEIIRAVHETQEGITSPNGATGRRMEETDVQPIHERSRQMTRNMIIGIWLTAFLHPVIFPCVKYTAKEIEKWWDKKRVLWHVEQLRKIEEKYKE